MALLQIVVPHYCNDPDLLYCCLAYDAAAARQMLGPCRRIGEPTCLSLGGLDFVDLVRNAIDKPFMSCDFDEASNNVEVEDIINIPVKFVVVSDMLETEEVKDGVASTSQRPQRTRDRPVRLQDYEVIGDDEVTPDGELVHFSLLTGVKSINYSEALNDKQ
ncbi:hypothetical protein KIW84_066260 [Lathyrus oleraceus]|uniref:Uncharacterized protein n=1 Tax=Pisum sativum TaxID=3888 RepID=A0A9D5ADK7_PEA|nr:hypothetical protein KIW84_066260 [Pisum sativum]